MKNIKNFYFVVFIAALAGAWVFSCSTGDNGGDSGQTLGTIQIIVRGSPVGPNNPASTGDTLYAQYGGQEEVSYQWKFGGANVGENRYSLLAEEPGSYTVTVSAPGYQSRTSAAVTVGGQALPALPGTLTITVNGVAVTTAQTGNELTAVYSGDNTPVEYQWFKDGTGLTTYSDPDDTVRTPIEAGSYFVRITASGYRAKDSDPVTVTGVTLIAITFDLNGAGYDHPEKLAAPGAAIGTLPDAPPRNGFSFVGWYSAQSGGTAITGQTTFDAPTTVYARWSFSGGIPYIDAETDTLVHENPIMEKGNSFAGSISEEDGTISFTAGAFQYKFPAAVNGASVNISDYVYFIVLFELKSAGGSGSGVLLKQYGNDTDYGGKTGNDRYPWLSNEGSGIRFMVSGAGTTGGFSIRYNGGEGNTIEVRIKSITFYKQAPYTVTFDLDGGTGTVPASITVYEGETLGAQFPANPTKEDYTFIGWKNGDGTIVTAATPIRGDWTLTAQWMLTSQVPVPVDEVAENGTLFAATGGSTAEKFDYDGKQWWVFAKTPVGNPAAVAPFDGAEADAYTAALAAAAAYARVSYNLPALSDMWQSFPRVTITYDLIVVGGSDLVLTVRNGTGGGGDLTIVEPTLVAGTGNTLTFNTSAIGTGNLAFVKRNNGGDALFLLRITKVELLME